MEYLDVVVIYNVLGFCPIDCFPTRRKRQADVLIVDGFGIGTLAAYACDTPMMYKPADASRSVARRKSSSGDEMGCYRRLSRGMILLSRGVAQPGSAQRSGR